MYLIKADQNFKSNLSEILCRGNWNEQPRAKYLDGTPAHTIYITQVAEKYDLSMGEFPFTTLRNTAIKKGIQEILWIYHKQSNSLKLAHEMGIDWWENWDVGDGTIGLRYGATVKEFGLMDNLLKRLEIDPFSHRHIISLWQEEHIQSIGLMPCAFMTMFSVRRKFSDLYLDMTLTQRSSDYIMAGYINKMQYVAFQMMVAGHLGYKVGQFSHIVQNLHIYDRHVAAAMELIEKPSLRYQPRIILKENKNFYDYTVDDFEIFAPRITKIRCPLEIAI